MRSPLKCLSLCFSALLILAAPAFGFGIGLQPTTVEMQLEPGERQRQVINIGNVHQEKTISLTIGLADWSLSEDGQIELAPPGEMERSSSEWVRFSPAFLTLEPGESEQIVVDMVVPSRLSSAGDHRFALIASTILPEERGGGSGVWRRYQLASLFYLTVGDAQSAPEIKSGTIGVDEEGRETLALRIENDGNAHARLDGMIEVETAEGEIKTQPLSNLVVLDQAARNFAVTLETPVADSKSISIYLDNTFAPQYSDSFDQLEPYAVPLPTRRAELDAEAESEL